MTQLKASAFASTKRNAAKGVGNTDPRKAYMQQPSVMLSKEGTDWLNERIEKAFSTFGKLPQAELKLLDWP